MDLIEGYLSGDHQSFEKIVIEYRQDAERFAEKIILDAYLAEDIVQDAFVCLYVQRHKYKRKYSLKTYLYTIIKNKCVDYIRKQSRLMLTDDFDIVENQSPESILMHKEHIEQIKHGLSQIRKPYQLAIHLVDYEELTYKEAAKIMEMSLSGFKVTLMRARKQFRSQVEGVLR